MRVGPIFGRRAEPGRADRAWPSLRPPQRVIVSNHGPKPDLVCEILIPRDVSPARQLVINRTGRPPGPVREVVRIF